MQITPALIKRAQSERDDVWSFGNRILYSMCAENPRHIHIGTVAGKVWLIDRSYAAAAERRTVPTEMAGASRQGAREGLLISR